MKYIAGRASPLPMIVDASLPSRRRCHFIMLHWPGIAHSTRGAECSALVLLARNADMVYHLEDVERQQLAIESPRIASSDVDESVTNMSKMSETAACRSQGRGDVSQKICSVQVDAHLFFTLPNRAASSSMHVCCDSVSKAEGVLGVK
jgi:hypothetical protein